MTPKREHRAPIMAVLIGFLAAFVLGKVMPL